MAFQWYRQLSATARTTLWIAFAGFCLDAMDIQIYAFVLPSVMADWQLAPVQAGLLTSVSLVASAFGGALGGMLADRIGRARMLRATLLLFTASTCGCAFAADFTQLLVARAAQGLAFGGEWAIGAVLVAESAPAAVRGRMVGLAQSAWVVGWGLAALLATAALALAPPGYGWRAAFLLGVAPAIGIYVLRRRLGEPTTYARAGKRVPWRAIFRRGLVGFTVKGSLLATGIHGAYWAIATWWPLLLSRHGLSIGATGLIFALLLAGALAGYLAGSWISDRFGRRAMLAGFAAAGIGLVAFSTLMEPGGRTLALLGAPLGFVVLGMYGAIGSLLAELFPTELRASGLGFCYNCGRGLSGATPLLVGAASGFVRLDLAIALLVVCSYLLVLVSVAMLPETLGRDLEAIAAPGP